MKKKIFFQKFLRCRFFKKLIHFFQNIINVYLGKKRKKKLEKNVFEKKFARNFQQYFL
ncbi:hypothetical protein ES703_84213 [subsurface metagenome]